MGVLPNFTTASASATAAKPTEPASSLPVAEAIAGSLPHRLTEEHILCLLGHLRNDGAVMVQFAVQTMVKCIVVSTVGATAVGLLALGITLARSAGFLACSPALSASAREIINLQT